MSRRFFTSCTWQSLLVALALTLGSEGHAKEKTKYLSAKELVDIGDKSEVSYATEIFDDPSDVPMFPHAALSGKPQEPLLFPVVSEAPDGGRSLMSYRFSEVAETALVNAEPAFDNGDFDTALGIYEAALTEDPDCYLLHSHIGDCHLQSGRPELALAAYERSVILNPSDFRGYWFKATALVRLGRLEEARQAYAEALALSPKNEKILQVLERAQDRIGINLDDEPFRPFGSARQTDEGVTVYAAEPTHWWVYGLCKAIWSVEESHRKRQTGKSEHRWTNTEERECLGALLNYYHTKREARETEAEPQLDRLLSVAEDGMLNEFILYELGSQTSPHFMLLLDDETRADVADYIGAHILGARRSERN